MVLPPDTFAWRVKGAIQKYSRLVMVQNREGSCHLTHYTLHITHYLFTRYVRPLIVKMLNKRIGCNIGRLFVSVLAYADDKVLLLSPSEYALQELITTREYGCVCFDISCSTKKTMCMVLRPKQRDRWIADVFPTFTVNGCNLICFTLLTIVFLTASRTTPVTYYSHICLTNSIYLTNFEPAHTTKLLSIKQNCSIVQISSYECCTNTPIKYVTSATLRS